jgi:adenylate kinase family enzyme
MGAVRRVSVVGNSGSGKTTFARRLALVLGVPYVELDAIHHLPNWEPMAPAAFLAAVNEVAATDAWVIDGNYRAVVVDGPVWSRADTVVWLDPPRWMVMRQVVCRTCRRMLTREELWNGNREPLRNSLSWDPHRSIIRWSWTQHDKYQDRFGSAMTSPAWAHVEFVRLRSRKAADEWLRALEARVSSSPDPRSAAR